MIQKDYLETDLQFIRGVGPVIAARLDEVIGGRRVLDFLLHCPSYIRSRNVINSVMDANAGDTITILLRIKSHKIGGMFRGRHRPTIVHCADTMGNTVNINFFGSSFLDAWLSKLPIGEVRLISGKLEYNNGFTINHPEFIEHPDNEDKIPKLQVVYPSGNGLSQKIFTNIRNQVFEKLECDNDEFFKTLKRIHFPESEDDLEPTSEFMVKLALDELTAHQSAIAIIRRNRKLEKNKKIRAPKKYDLMNKFLDSLPFTLTNAQQRVNDEIKSDMEKDIPMMRLVQGDVGSGKTMVAMYGVVLAAERGHQTALLAPTDTLAMQHYEKLSKLCNQLDLHCEILTGRDKGKARNEKLISIRSGRAKLIIGTHALFSDDVIYKDLDLVIIDEQHRFGVAQRNAICARGNNPDILALSATPIPRTLSMTMYGDMDISVLNEKPAGRLPIKTTKLSVSRINDLTARLKPQIANKASVFWVCPLVEDNDTSNLTAVETRAEYLRKIFGSESVGLVHGKMDKRERDKIMEKFSDKNSNMKILVSTTVIEVGIDVPHATIMVIENAERFGLAALHQLRGRVGRGDLQSFCILVFGYGLSDEGVQRLNVLCESDDGFYIAEQDLIMRGTGELLGTRQSGWIRYHFVRPRYHSDLFKIASNLAMNEPDARIKNLMDIFDIGDTINK